MSLFFMSDDFSLLTAEKYRGHTVIFNASERYQIIDAS